MRAIKAVVIAVALAAALTKPAAAHDMSKEHGGQVFHMFRLEGAYGGGAASWDLDGWAGTDDHKIWLKSEGEYKDSALEEATLWALYSRNISTFWDAQAGLRYDVEPSSVVYAVLGFNGLAPYWFETEAHAFISEDGDVSARLHLENDFLITQALILQPYAEVNVFAQDVPDRDTGAGVSDAAIGLQTRYELSRAFAPYVDVRYGSKFGETASIARRHGEDNDELTSAIGLRLVF